MKACIFAAALVVVSLAFAGGGDHTVTSTPLVVFGPAKTPTAQAWVASTAYTQGALVKADGQFYVAIVAGTSSTVTPSGTTDFVDGTVTWRAVLRKTRDGLFVKNNGTSEITVVVDNGLQGIKLEAAEHLTWSGNVPQNAIKLSSGADLTNSVYVSEW